MITFIGDVHGDFAQLTDKLAELTLVDSFFIQVGDFGVGFKNKADELVQLESLNKELQKKNNVMYAIRGNHDDPNYFDGDVSYSNLHLLKDYTLLNLEGETILLVGGAVSIDRYSKILDSSYWKKEIFVFKESSLSKTTWGIQNLDIVVTHSAPAKFAPIEMSDLVMSFADKDSQLIADLRKERSLHSRLLHAFIKHGLKPKFWFYGHFHISAQGVYEGITYRALNSIEFVEYKKESPI